MSSSWRGGALAMVMLALAGCSSFVPTDHPPCWTVVHDFTYEPMSISGVVGVDITEGQESLLMGLPDGRVAQLAWPQGFTETYGPGAGGLARNTLGFVVARSGERVTLWGALIRAATSSRSPAAAGRDGFVVCEVNGSVLGNAK